MMGHYWIRNNCCRCARLSAIYFTTLTIQAVVIVQSIAFLLVGYLRGAKIYSETYRDLNYVLHFDCLIPLIVIQISWFVSAASTIYSMQRIIPYLMLPHLFTSLILLITAVLLITLTTYHITKGLRFNCSLMLLLLLPSLYSFGALYSIYLTLSCFRLLIRKRKTVANIAENEIRKEALEDQEISSSSNTISYSRRSTIIDEELE
ncbi:Ribosomal RNA small subunit methyltransferase [Dirofilaria immitis]